LAPDRFRVVTGAGFVASDQSWLESSRSDDDVRIRDVSDELATIGLWGPRARKILAEASPDAVDDAALPLRRAVGVKIGGAPVLAARISYAGELGWELTTDRSRAVTVWDALRRSGADHGLEPFGYRALDALRMEKGYRYYSIDMTMLDTPFEAGLGSFVRLAKGPFSVREALRAAAERDEPGRRLATVLIGDPGDPPVSVYGGEAVRSAGRVIGRLRSVAFGPTVSRTIGYVYRPAEVDVDVDADADLTIDVFDRRVAASWAPDVLVDPAGERMRG